ncbi:MAG: hypothetical protein J1E05_04370 [Eubacterium sp.]|nr:hypothetical protein [Eubacterium sp.]
MFWSIISEADVIFDEKTIRAENSLRSSNPYDYLRKGYYVDNASMFGGKDFVNFNSDNSGYWTSPDLYTADIRKRTFGNIS